MCDILVLQPGVMIPKHYLENVVWNNPHGYGLLVQTKNGLKLIKNLHTEGTNPDDIEKLLKDNIKYNRYLHLRWKTEGEVTLDNCHPFIVYESDDDIVYFMHNGTLYDYRPKEVNGVKDPRSDSKIFADSVLQPLLNVAQGDYTLPIIIEIINKFWGLSGNNRGLLISNKRSPLFINLKDWKQMKVKYDNEDVEFYSSNDDYFYQLKRGFEFDRREEQRKKEQSFRSENNQSPWELTKFQDISFKPFKNMANEVLNIFSENKIDTPEGLASLSNLTWIEFEDFIKKNSDNATILVLHVTHMFSELLNKHKILEKKHDKATRLISELKGQPNV